MGSNVGPEEQFTHVTADRGETKSFSQLRTLRPQAFFSSRQGVFEGYIPLSSESDPIKQLLGWIIDSSSGLHNYTRIYMLCLHLVIGILLAMLWLHSCVPNTTITNSNGSWSPAKEFVERRIEGYWPSKNDTISVYTGKPTSEQDTAWDDIFSSMYFAASREEIDKAGESIVDQMVEVSGGGYLATLGVYHELHCLRQLRLHLYEDRYYHNLTDRQRAHNRLHLDHCLEVLRITVMCNGNTDMFTFVSRSRTPGKPTIKSNAKSLCLDWSSLQQWSQLRKLNATQHALPPDSWNVTAMEAH
ncbi:hypothetical protein F4860DRAFT_99761 [Xylaria cubensis]|nr:hypothetical protein F4860DRAFT_99761 [Xylaria cubensis]